MAHTFTLRRFLVPFFALVLVLGACGATETTVVVGDTASGTATTSFVEFQASPAFLAQSADRVEAVDNYRFEIRSEIDVGAEAGFPGTLGSRTDPLGFGEVAGSRSKVFMDLGSMTDQLAELGEALLGFPFEMTMITDGDVLYLNAPFFQMMLDEGGDALGGAGFGWVQVVADGWGRIDARELAGDDVDILEELESMGGLQGGGPDEFLAILRDVGAVTDGGASAVRGVPTRVARADVSMGDLMELSGQDIEEFGGVPEMDDFFSSFSMNIDVHVDDSGLVRRVEYTMNLGEMAAGVDVVATEFSMWQQIDFFDFGEPVVIDIPQDAVDITADFLALMEMSG